ncbi:hypothetical protein HPB48_023858 [Haemaphysalis longicornis]|uniref:Uncharacterized protein n=1 Tax=Haemaphysalis longicornis TaxID=44386 RepID=A0A9J6H639_HAELO|nr:hypothetical protein HPB48_023858 [Haemaphysalis longicornis]
MGDTSEKLPEIEKFAKDYPPQRSGIEVTSQASSFELLQMQMCPLPKFCKIITWQDRTMAELVEKNQQLEKQKADLLALIKKQMKLIDILKKQKVGVWVI